MVLIMRVFIRFCTVLEVFHQIGFNYEGFYQFFFFSPCFLSLTSALMIFNIIVSWFLFSTHV